MRSLQDVLITLLEELDDICKENDIEYCISGRTAESLVRKGIIEDYDSEIIVLMTVENAEKFITATNGNLKPDRAVEHMCNNPMFPNFGIRYTATDTFYYPLSNTSRYTIKNRGIHIRIEIVRSQPSRGIAVKYNDMLEIGWRCNQNPYLGLRNPKRFISMSYVRALMVSGRGNLGKHLFNKWCRKFKCTDPNDPQYYIRPKIRKILLSDNLFSTGFEKVILNGREYPVPRFIYHYAKHELSGSKWPSYDPDRSGDLSDSLLYSTMFSFDDYKKRMPQEGIDIDHIYKIRRKVQIAAVMVKPQNKVKNKGWNVACRSGDRLKLLEEYAPKFSYLQYLYDDRDIDTLKAELEPYTKALMYYHGKGLGLCVHPFLTELQNKLLIAEGQEDLVNEIEAMIPERHRKPIVPVDYLLKRQDEVLEDYKPELEG